MKYLLCLSMKQLLNLVLACYVSASLPLCAQPDPDEQRDITFELDEFGEGAFVCVHMQVQYLPWDQLESFSVAFCQVPLL